MTNVNKWYCNPGAYAGGVQGFKPPPPPPFGDDFFFFFFFWHPGGRRTVHMYPLPSQLTLMALRKKSVGVPPPRSSAFLGLARPSRLATGENHPLYKILRTLVLQPLERRGQKKLA